LWTSSFPRGSHRDSTAIFISGGVPKNFIQLSAVAVDMNAVAHSRQGPTSGSLGGYA
jgi:deoxyhypusine synthase